MLAPGISVSSTICCLSLQLQRRRRSTVITSARCIVLEVRLSLLLEPSHSRREDQGGLTERLRTFSGTDAGNRCLKFLRRNRRLLQRGGRRRDDGPGGGCCDEREHFFRNVSIVADIGPL